MASERSRVGQDSCPAGPPLPQIDISSEQQQQQQQQQEYPDQDDDDFDIFSTPVEEHDQHDPFKPVQAAPTTAAATAYQATAADPTAAIFGRPRLNMALTGRQEHYLKRELISLQVTSEISSLNSPTALRTFGPPFRSDDPRIAIESRRRRRHRSSSAASASGPFRPDSSSSAGSGSGSASMTAIENSQLPILRYVFSHHIRNFPFLDSAREKEFWQFKLQVFLESFASKHISPSADRHEQTKRRKIAIKCEKLLELMMVSALRTSSGYEERIQFSEIEVIDRGANESGLLVNKPEGGWINGWDVNVAGVRVLEGKRRIMGKDRHAQFILTVRHDASEAQPLYVGRRFGDFARLLKRLHTQFPGKILPALPHKNKSSAEVSAEAVDSPRTAGQAPQTVGSFPDTPYADSILDDAGSIRSSETGWTYGADDSTSGSGSARDSIANVRPVTTATATTTTIEGHRLSTESASQLIANAGTISQGPMSSRRHAPSFSQSSTFSAASAATTATAGGAGFLQVPGLPADASAGVAGGHDLTHENHDSSGEDTAGLANSGAGRRRSFHRSRSIGRKTKEKLRNVKSHAEMAISGGAKDDTTESTPDPMTVTGTSPNKSRRHLGRRRHRSHHNQTTEVVAGDKAARRSTTSLHILTHGHRHSPGDGQVMLYREQQRVSLRAFLRTLLQNSKIASSKAMIDFLTTNPVPPSELTSEDSLDMSRRNEIDHRRLLEQQRFFEVARKRAQELDVYMEKFRQSVVEDNGLSRLFREIKEKNSIQELSPEYVKFVEWARIEVAAALYHMFLADDNAPELFAQMKRIHSLIPYTLMKNVIRLTNPAAVMAGVLDIFLAQPFGSRSLIQRILGMAMGDGIRSLQKAVDVLTKKITAPDKMTRSSAAAASVAAANADSSEPEIDVQPMLRRLRAFVESDEEVKQALREQAENEQNDIVVVICMADAELLFPGYQLAATLAPSIIPPAPQTSGGWFGRSYAPEPKAAVGDLDLSNHLVEWVFNSYVAWVSAVEDENTDADEAAVAVADLQANAIWFAWLKQLVKVLIRQRDKRQMLEVIEEPVTVSLFRDLFTIFYEPLVRVYKSANVYSSITDFAAFVDDAIVVIERAQSQDFSADPNVTVQSFIDLCARHQDNFYKFVHEVHLHDNGLFDSLMGWIEDILSFLRHGPSSGRTLDINSLFEHACQAGEIDRAKCTDEINALIRWHEARKRWHYDKTRQKMATEIGPSTASGMTSSAGAGAGAGGEALPGLGTFSGADFGLHEADLEELAMADEALDGESDEEGSSNYSAEEGVGSDDDGGNVGDSGGDAPASGAAVKKAKSGLIAAERRRRAKRREREKLRSTAGEPVKPKIEEILKLRGDFQVMIRETLAS
ncbi:hypothetical protein KEM52_000047 [Ascosphaera acerosa]|nr:hypothetical protein KEM52_000047 [Ascosphaera acerosa]